MKPDLLDDLIRTANFFFWLAVAIIAVFYVLLSIVTQPASAETDQWVQNNCGVTPASNACRGVSSPPLVSDVPPQTNSQSYSTCVVVGANLYCAHTQPAR